MEGARTYQTAFRFKPEMMERMKNRARQKNKSLNAYVEELIKNDLERENRYESLLQQLKNIRIPEKVNEIELPFKPLEHPFTSEELEADERLSYILRRNDEDIH